MDYTWPVLMASPDGGSGGGILTLVWFGLLIVVMYLLLIRPQRKKQKEHEQLLADLKKGDKVVTTGGLFGTISAMNDEKGRVVIKINEQTKLEFLKSAIAARVDE